MTDCGKLNAETCSDNPECILTRWGCIKNDCSKGDIDVRRMCCGEIGENDNGNCAGKDCIMDGGGECVPVEGYAEGYPYYEGCMNGNQRKYVVDPSSGYPEISEACKYAQLHQGCPSSAMDCPSNNQSVGGSGKQPTKGPTKGPTKAQKCDSARVLKTCIMQNKGDPKGLNECMVNLIMSNDDVKEVGKCINKNKKDYEKAISCIENVLCPQKELSAEELGIIIGCSVGGGLLLILLIVLLVRYNKKGRRRGKK